MMPAIAGVMMAVIGDAPAAGAETCVAEVRLSSFRRAGKRHNVDQVSGVSPSLFPCERLWRRTSSWHTCVRALACRPST